MYSFKNKIAIVTGGANGIGASTVKEFLKEGAKFVAILDIQKDDGLKLQNELTKKHGVGRVKFFYCDVTNLEQMYDVFNNVSKNHGYIDLVVNNAGVADESGEKYLKVIGINFTACIASSLKALELMREDHGGKGGTIINISSIAALSPVYGEVPVYSGTKSGILQFSCCLSKANLSNRTKVRVLSICFGATDTNILGLAKTFDDKLNDIIKSLRYNTQTSEVAAQGVVQAYKAGKCGSTWVINDGKVFDITDKINKANEIMCQDITNVYQ